MALALVGPAMWSGLLSAQDFNKGLEAAERGDFAMALQEWRPLAEQAVNGGVRLGHGAAQNWATLGLRETRSMGGGQSAALSM
jgi:hypothetical protein